MQMKISINKIKNHDNNDLKYNDNNNNGTKKGKQNFHTCVHELG